MDLYLKFPNTAVQLEKEFIGRAMQLTQRFVVEELERGQEQSVANATIAARVALRLKEALVR